MWNRTVADDSARQEDDEEPNFELEDFEVHTEDNNQVLLGKGSFATVYLVRCRKDQKLYALKVVCL
jgi:hypothetical protein